jgi:hypothetical protein
MQLLYTMLNLRLKMPEKDLRESEELNNFTAAAAELQLVNINDLSRIQVCNMSACVCLCACVCAPEREIGRGMDMKGLRTCRCISTEYRTCTACRAACMAGLLTSVCKSVSPTSSLSLSPMPLPYLSPPPYSLPFSHAHFSRMYTFGSRPHICSC